MGLERMSTRQAEVLRAAIELLDEVGLDALTTRRLAARLGVQAGALYRHYPSKRALLDAMVEHIVAEAGTGPRPDGDWAAQLRTLATGMRRGMLAHRDGARLMATFQAPGEAARASFEALVGLLVRAGATREDAAVGIDTLVCFVNGFAVEEQARSAGAPRDRAFEAGVDVILSGIRASVLA